jgi:hypothetical protein
MVWAGAGEAAKRAMASKASVLRSMCAPFGQRAF